jgi:hypothetical protein
MDEEISMPEPHLTPLRSGSLVIVLVFVDLFFGFSKEVNPE